jgi:hypothetical protein
LWNRYFRTLKIENVEIIMKNLVLTMVGIALLASTDLGHAISIESSTSVYLTFRNCISGDSVCDKIGPSQIKTVEGLPGDQEAQASQDDPGFGSATGSARLTGEPGGSEHSGKAGSLPGKRNGANTAMLQKYTNTSSYTETLTFVGDLTYDQTVPDQNSGFPDNSPGTSGAVGHLGVVRFGDALVEAGTTAQDNFHALTEEPEGATDYTDLGSDTTEPISNISEAGDKTLSVIVKVQPGESIWLWAGTQSLATNGAEVLTSLTTLLHVN